MSLPEFLEPPKGLDDNARLAWGRMVAAAQRPLAAADAMALEAAARAWARWKALEERIAEVGAGNVLAGELSLGADKKLQVSALRTAANDAWRSFRDIASGYGFAPPTTEAPVPEADLFGYPDRPGRGQKGRPSFHASPRDRNRVRLLLALGWSNERIASALEITPPTLRKYFRVELRQREAMRDRLDARLLEIAISEANAGSITALREVQRLVEKNDTMQAEASVARRLEAPAEPKPERLGKKEIDARLAEDADAALMAELELEARGRARH